MGGTYSIQNDTAYNWYYKDPLSNDSYECLPSGALGTNGVTQMICLKYGNHTSDDLLCHYGGYEYRIIEKRNSRQFQLQCGTDGHKHVCPHFDEREKYLQRQRQAREQREREAREQRERQAREQRERQAREQWERQQREQREREEKEQRERQEREQREQLRQEQEHRSQQRREQEMREQQRQEYESRQAFRGKTTHLTTHLFQSDNTGEEWNELLEVEEEFIQLLSDFDITEDEDMQDSTLKDRMTGLFVELIEQNFEGDHLSFSLIVTIEQKIGFQDMPLSEKLTVLRAMLKQTPDPSYNDLVPHLKGREACFVLSLLEKLQQDNPDTAVRILHSLTEYVPCLTPQSSETLGYILYNGIWTPVEVMRFLQSLQNSTSHHMNISAILEIALQNGFSSSSVLSALEKANPIDDLMKEVKSEQDKDLDRLISEMRDNYYPESTLRIIYAVLNEIQDELECRFTERCSRTQTKVILKQIDFDDPEINLLRELLIAMCFAVRQFMSPQTLSAWKGWRRVFNQDYIEAQKEPQGYFPRLTQLASLLILLLPQSRIVKGCVLQVATGEGKTCIVAMFAAIQAMRGLKPDIVTSSPVLASRDQQKWQGFYAMFGLNSSVVPPEVTSDNYEELVTKAYGKHIVYGTMGTFAADTLRQEFEGQTTRGSRPFEMAIVDEVDFMTLDNGMQVTFLSHDTSILRHVEQVLAAIWAMLSACRPIEVQEKGEMQWTTRPQVLHKTVESALNISQSVALEILQLAVELGFCKQAEMNEFIQADTEMAVQDDNQDFRDGKWKALENIMSKIGPDEQYKLLRKFEEQMEEDVPMEYFSVKDDKTERYGDTPIRNDGIRLLLLENGYACQIIPESQLITVIVNNLKSKIMYSEECKNIEQFKERTDNIMVPSFLRGHTENQLNVFAESALRAIVMVEGREYMIEKAQEADSKEDSEKESHQFDAIIPVDFMSSGILQKNSRWGEGLQQFLEMKHQMAISPLSTVTNYMSNIHYLQRYVRGRGVFGLTGTLGGDAEKDFLFRRYQTNSSIIPTHRHKKLVEVPAVIVQQKDWKREDRNGESEWNEKICELTLKAAKQVVLIICEDVKTANSLHATMRTKANLKSISLYTISGRHNIEMETFGAGDVIIATNLAGRGTDIQLKPDVNTHGGLFVILTYFPTSERVEKQAFGRTARKGNPGMVQMVLNKERLEPVYQGQTIHTMRQRRSQRERENIEHMEADELHVIDIKDNLFSVFCQYLDNFRKHYTDEEKKTWADMKNIPDCFKSYRPRFDFQPAVNALKESWAFWLSHNEKHICEAKIDSEIKALVYALQEELKLRGERLLEGQSLNFHDHIKQAENRTEIHRWSNGESFGADTYWEKAAQCDEVYSAIALYNQAYVTINLREKGYMSKAEQLLNQTNDLVDVFLTETTNTMSFCHLSVTSDFKPHSEHSNFSTQMETRMNIYKSWKGYINQALDKLKELKDSEDDAVTEVSTVYRLLDDKDFIVSSELRTMDKYGLGIVFEVKKKPKFSIRSLICFIIGVLQVAAGILVCALSAGSATSFGMGLITEGVSDMIEGVKGMVTGTFSWADWAISKAISIGTSLICGAFKLVQKCGLSLKRIGQTIQKGIKNTLTTAKSSTTFTMKQTAKQAFKYSAQEMAKQGVLAGVNAGIDKALNAFFHKCCENIFGNDVGALVKGNKTLCTAVRLYICEEYPKEIIKKGTYFKLDPECERDISESIQSMTETVTPQLLTGLTKANDVIRHLSQAANIAKQKIKGSATLSAITNILEYAATVSSITEMLVNIPTTEIINGEFVPLLLTTLKQSQKSQMPENHITHREMLSDVQMLQDKIMEEIAKIVSATFVDTLAEKVTSLACRGINKTINKRAGKVVGNVLGMHKTTAFFENQKMNHKLRVASQTPTESLTRTKEMALQSYAEHQSSTERPATGADLHILTMSPLLEGKGIRVIITDEHGKPCYEEHYPGSKKSAGDITLHLQRTKDQSQQENGLWPSCKRRIGGELQLCTGHFKVVNANRTTSPVHSEGQNCLYHAIVQATSGGQRDVNDLRRDAAKLRHDVGQEVTQNLAKYAPVLRLQKHYEENLNKLGRYTIGGGANKTTRAEDHNKYKHRTPTKYHDNNLGFVSTHSDVLAARKKLRKEKKKDSTWEKKTVNSDHMPPLYCVDKSRNSSDLQKNNPSLYKYWKDGRGGGRGNELFAMEVQEEHHKKSLSWGKSNESVACRGKLIEVLHTGDMEKALKMTFIAAHPQTSMDLRRDLCINNQPSSKMQDVGYYKPGFQRMADKYFEKDCITEDNLNNLQDWVKKDRYLHRDTTEYEQLRQHMTDKLTLSQPQQQQPHQQQLQRQQQQPRQKTQK